MGGDDVSVEDRKDWKWDRAFLWHSSSVTFQRGWPPFRMSDQVSFQPVSDCYSLRLLLLLEVLILERMPLDERGRRAEG